MRPVATGTPMATDMTTAMGTSTGTGTGTTMHTSTGTAMRASTAMLQRPRPRRRRPSPSSRPRRRTCMARVVDTTTDPVPPLLRLVWLASPALPIGAFSYSEGLEAAVEHGHVHDDASAGAWLS